MKTMKLICLSLLVLSLGCTKSGSSISPLQQAGCTVEQLADQAEASAIAGLLSCTNVQQIASDIQTALGNANLCAAPIPAPVPAVSAVKSAVKWQKIGDVTQADIDAAKGKLSEKAVSLGIVGSIGCPIVVNVIMGYGTNAVPSSWACTVGASAASLSAALIQACELAVPI